VPPETFLTISQVADRLDLSPESVARLIQRQKIKTVHTQASGQVRISGQELASFIAEQEEVVKRFLEEGGQATFNELSQSFHEQIGRSHEDWLRGWRDNEFPDSAENMRLAVRATALSQWTEPTS
jgi:hypothetical protein